VASVASAAQASLAATEHAQRATRLALVGQTLSAWLTLAADAEQLALAEKTLRDREATQELAGLRYRVGALAEPDWRSTQALTAAARATLAQAQRQRQLSENALHLLVGQPVPAALLPESRIGALAEGRWLSDVPAGLASDTLLVRPDVMQAEAQLRASNANLGAARAALWPRISLSASGGSVTKQLADLFSSGTFAWTLLSQATVALFDSGRNAANQKVAELNLQSAVLAYQKTVQTAFREAADGLTSQSTWRQQLAAQRAQTAAEAERHRLARLKLQAGATSQLDWLDAERSLAATQQALVQAQLAELLSRVGLWKALGGDERGG
jgi:NodT family efflux transporter outer membrane factor (OMF) lipoprotein